MAHIAESVNTGRAERELIASDSALAPFISVDPGRLGGEPCFRGTRVMVASLFEFLGAGDPISEFLTAFPGVTREQAVGVLDLSQRGLLDGLRKL